MYIFYNFIIYVQNIKDVTRILLPLSYYSICNYVTSNIACTFFKCFSSREEMSVLHIVKKVLNFKLWLIQYILIYNSNNY